MHVCDQLNTQRQSTFFLTSHSTDSVLNAEIGHNNLGWPGGLLGSYNVISVCFLCVVGGRETWALLA